MSTFGLFFQLGVEHITNLKGYDHILFLITLCAVYSFVHWKKVLILVTAFTVGHTTTLAMATLNMISMPTDLIEFLIALTIFITALINIFYKTDAYSSQLHTFKYFAALFFGLIHGLGFSNYLKSMLNQEQNFSTALFSFNLGVETGQIIIVVVALLIAMLIVDMLKYSRREWNLILSGSGLGLSLIMMIERI